MTEDVFEDMMKTPDSGFDAMAPENVSPLVVWLGSAESKEVTGRIFEVAGGEISVADGWRSTTPIDNKKTNVMVVVPPTKMAIRRCRILSARFDITSKRASSKIWALKSSSTRL